MPAGAKPAKSGDVNWACMHTQRVPEMIRGREVGRDVLEGYVSGPDATTRATVRAMARVAGSRAVVLVEGISDQIALETLALRRGRDLGADGVVILPVGGAHAMAAHLKRLGPEGADLRLAGLCDANEEDVVCRGLASAGFGSPLTRAEMESLGFHVCVDDLEDELLRAVGAARFKSLLESQGDLRALRSLQKQPEWRDRDLDSQLRRFLGSVARRKLRYARILVEAVDLDRVPRPLDAVLAHV